MASDVQKFSHKLSIGIAAVAVTGTVALAATYRVAPGKRAVIVDRLKGIREDIVPEGIHFLLPFLQRAVMFDVGKTSREISINAKTTDGGTVNLLVIVIFHPKLERLPVIYKNFGADYADTVLPDIVETIVRSNLTKATCSMLQHDEVRPVVFSEVNSRFELMDLILDELKFNGVVVNNPKPDHPSQENSDEEQEYIIESPNVSAPVTQLEQASESNPLPDSGDAQLQTSSLSTVLDRYSSSEPFSWSEEMSKTNVVLCESSRRDSHGTPDSDESDDSGRATGPPPVYSHTPEVVPQYEFEIHNSLVGLVIGVGGKTIKELSTRTGVVLEIKPHYNTDLADTHQICQVRGKREQINKCLCMLRHRFPPERFPELNLQPVLPFPPLNYVHPPNKPSWLTLPECVSAEITVCSMITPGHFFVQQPTHPSFSSQALLDRYMLGVYSNKDAIPTLPKEECLVGIVVAAPVMDAWFRAVTLSYAEEEDEVLVRFVDYGGYQRVKREDLRQIRNDLLRLPFQAVECYLANVQPADGTSVWCADAYDIFQDAIMGKVIEAHVAGYAVHDDLPCVEITITDDDQKTQRLDSLLIQLGVAKAADPTKMRRVPKAKTWNPESYRPAPRR